MYVCSSVYYDDIGSRQFLGLGLEILGVELVNLVNFCLFNSVGLVKSSQDSCLIPDDVNQPVASSPLTVPLCSTLAKTNPLICSCKMTKVENLNIKTHLVDSMRRCPLTPASRLATLLNSHYEESSLQRCPLTYLSRLAPSKNNKVQNQHPEVKTNKVNSTATMLDCCLSDLVHTDAVSWNKYMRMSNGNGPGKVKDFVDCMYQNLPGVLSVPILGTQLGTIVTRMNPDVLIVGEADSENVKAACPDGYNWVGGSLKNSKKTIRVSALVKENLPYKTFTVRTKVPVVGLKIGEWRVLGIYREWALEGDKDTKARELQIERLSNFVDYWLTVRCKCICIGDFNFDPSPGTEYQRSLEPIRSCVNDIILPAGWRQLVRGHTRSEAGQEPATLDHVYVNAVDKTTRVWNEGCSGYDHNLVGVRFKARGVVFKQETFEYRDLKTVTAEQFKEAWEETNPSDIFEEKEDVSEAVKIWEHKMAVALEAVAPLQRVITKPKNNPWVTKELKELCKERDLRKKEADLWGTREAKSRYRKYRNYVTNTLKKARFEWTRDHLTTDDSKKWWARVKRLAGLVKVGGEDMVIKDEDGNSITKPEELSEFFNNFFKDKVTKLQATLKVDKEAVIDYAKEYMREKGMETPPDFSFKTVGTGDINKVIKKLKNTSAQGRDGISTLLLKQFKGAIAPALRHIVNLAIKTGEYPNPWKVGLITPLPKSGDLSVVSTQELEARGDPSGRF